MRPDVKIEPPPKRKRGRPKKGEIPDTLKVSNEKIDPPPKRKCGRPKKEEVPDTLNVSNS